MVPIRGRHGETGTVPLRDKAPRGSHRPVAWYTMKTPYDVLGISPDADEKTIAIAFREAAKRCHPDLNPGDRVPTQDLATLEEDVQERERAPPASKQQRHQ